MGAGWRDCDDTSVRIVIRRKHVPFTILTLIASGPKSGVVYTQRTGERGEKEFPTLSGRFTEKWFTPSFRGHGRSDAEVFRQHTKFG